MPSDDAANYLLLSTDNEKLVELVRLLDEAYKHYFEFSDGMCKMSEGNVSVDFGNYFDREDGKRNLQVTVYSYVLGPHRNHYFGSVDEALTTVREWHKAEMETDYSKDAWSDV